MDATDLAYAGIARQAELIAAGEISSRELVQLYLDRIERYDGQLNAYRTVFAERALLEADQADARRGAGERSLQTGASGANRPLLGVPIAIKDDTDVIGDVTSHGTAAAERPASADQEVVRRLREAGAVIIGKTNVPELTLWPFTETPTFGVTRNPWNLQHTPGGSSGGSGAAVAAGLVGAALGSDGLGSIRIPSSFCGLFGIKPQRHRISLAPHTEELYGWRGLAVYGPIARGVRDASLFLDVTAQTPPARGSFADAAARAPGRLRIAYSTKPILPQPVDARELRAHQQAVELLRSLGHELVERDPDYPPWLGPHMVARYLRGANETATDIGNVERMQLRSRHIVRAGELLGERGINRALAYEAALNERMGRLFADHDALLLPSTARPALRVGEYEGRGMLWTMAGCTRVIPFLGTWNATGQPAVSIPAGFTEDSEHLPLAFQLVGRPDDEATLIALAAQIEAERPWAQHRPPGFS
ncbi:MAG TPA: amidase [Solirubrobacteraceae bacterium]|nr:amidase [Solirubrobacteraceae bacterium]